MTIIDAVSTLLKVCLRNEPKTERCPDLRERPKSNLQNLKTYIRLYPHSLEKLSTAEQESYNTHSDKRSRFKIKLNIIFIATIIIISRCIVIITIVFIFISIIIKNFFFHSVYWQRAKALSVKTYETGYLKRNSFKRN